MMMRFLLVGSSDDGATPLRLALPPSSTLDVAVSPEAARPLLASGTYALVFLCESLVTAEWVQTLRASEAALPVVVLTSSDDATRAGEMIAAGAVDCLSPAEIDGAHVARAVRHARTQSQLWLSERACAVQHRVLMQSGQGIWRFEFVPPVPTSAPCDDQIEAMIESARLVECNDIKARMYGFAAASDIEGVWLRDVVCEGRAALTEFFGQLVRSNYQLHETELLEFDRHGEAKYFLQNVTGTLENGCLVSAWGAQRDITASKHSETVQTRLNSIPELRREFIEECRANITKAIVSGI